MPRWIYCKYCYKNVQPQILYEHIIDTACNFNKKSFQVRCGICEAGLEPPRELSEMTWEKNVVDVRFVKKNYDKQSLVFGKGEVNFGN